MRQERLTGYVLHCLPYQEKKAIYHFFSKEHGMVHGIAARGLQPFVLIELFASGKSNLKTFSHCAINATQNQMSLQPVFGQVQYALLYLNEILCKLLAHEQNCEVLWNAYDEHTNQLKQLGFVNTKDSKMQQIRLLLRSFERVLFDEFGVHIVLDTDHQGCAIKASDSYFFVPGSGFVPLQSAQQLSHGVSHTRYQGADLLSMAQTDDDVYVQKLALFSKIQRAVMDYLLDYKPLNSRKLWQQSQLYQKI